MFVLGIDIGKRELYISLVERRSDAPLRSVAQQGPFANTPAGLNKLRGWLHRYAPDPHEVHVVMEATNVYWERCAQVLHAHHCTVSVVNPAQIKYFARSVLRRGKTDAMDADLIARYGAVMHPSAWCPPAAVYVELKGLVREREAVLLHLTQEHNHLLALQDSQLHAELAVSLAQQRVDLLQAQVELLDQALRDLVAGHAELQHQTRLLMSVPGFGFLSAVTVLGETEGFAHLETGREISAAAGMAPCPNQSGVMNRRGSISKTGNARLRRISYLAALGARRSHSRLGRYYEDLKARGKPPKVALVALGRKLLRTGLAVVKSGVPYRDDFVRFQDGLGPTPEATVTP